MSDNEVAYPPSALDITRKAVESIGFEKRPPAISAQVNMITRESFTAYLGSFASGTAVMFYREKSGSDNLTSLLKIMAILDYHRAETPSWCRHVCTFEPELSRQIKTWAAASGMHMDQARFAEFLEANRRDVVEPSSGELLDAARSLSLKREVTYSSTIREHDGSVRFEYSDTATGVRNETAPIPERFKVWLAVYRYEAPQMIDAVLRYRLKDGRLTLWYELEDLDRQLEEATEEVVKGVAAEFTSIPMFRGDVATNQGTCAAVRHEVAGR